MHAPLTHCMPAAHGWVLEHAVTEASEFAGSKLPEGNMAWHTPPLAQSTVPCGGLAASKGQSVFSGCVSVCRVTQSAAASDMVLFLLS
jgi:hypothetical protein